MLPTHLLALLQSSATRQPAKARVMSTWLGLGLGLGFGLGLGLGLGLAPAEPKGEVAQQADQLFPCGHRASLL